MKASSPYKRAIRELILFFILLLLTLPHSYGFDRDCWMLWSMDISKHGLSEIYYTNVNYPPVMMYILSLHNWIQGPESMLINIVYLKIFPLLFDLLPVVILILLRKAGDLKKGYHYLLLFNIAYLYNTLIWGQVDSIHTNLALTAI